MNAFVIFVKAPVAGAVKTRLWPPVPPASAAALYRAFVADTLDQAGRVSLARLNVAYETAPQFPDLSWLPVRPPAAFAQEGRTLGERLEHAFDACLDRRSKVVIIGSDAPHIRAATYLQAFEALERADVVLGPSRDGGYYLIGLNRPQPRLFRDIPWSTAGVLRATQERARDIGLRVALLADEFDVDDFSDLKRLARLLMRGEASAPRTRQAIQDLSHAALF